MSVELSQEDFLEHARTFNAKNQRGRGWARGRRSQADDDTASRQAAPPRAANPPMVIDHDNGERERAKQEATRRDRRLKRGMTVVLVLLAVCISIVGVVWWKTRDNGETEVASGFSNNESPDGEQLCNGLATNCNRRVNEIMYAGVHNAMSSKEDNFVAYNNLKSLEVSSKDFICVHIMCVMSALSLCYMCFLNDLARRLWRLVFARFSLIPATVPAWAFSSVTVSAVLDSVDQTVSLNPLWTF